MTKIGTTFTKYGKKALLCGSGELGKEVAIELQRFGVQVVAVDKYENAPAMQVAHSHHVIPMLDGAALREIIEQEKPDFIIPEIEAIATDTLVAMEAEGFNVVPTAKATRLTMNREGIRRLAAETLGLPTSAYRFASTREEFDEAVREIGFPCVVKPVMSSSGKGQSTLKSEDDIEKAFEYACTEGRGHESRVIVEGFVKFDREITLLTVSAIDGIHFCEPIGHRQENGDYRESWQPEPLEDEVLIECKRIASRVVKALGGFGIFGVELFICGKSVIFSELSPRPHDTGMVTLISQNLSEFALHARALLGLPIGEIKNFGPAASAAILVKGHGNKLCYQGLSEALATCPNGSLRIFGKPEVNGERRMGVALALGDTIQDATQKACQIRDSIKITVEEE